MDGNLLGGCFTCGTKFGKFGQSLGLFMQSHTVTISKAFMTLDSCKTHIHWKYIAFNF